MKKLYSVDDTADMYLIKGEEAPEIVSGVEFLCPFCGGHVVAGFEADESAVINHALPVCAKYLDLPMDEFMYQARLKFQGDAS